MEKETSSSTHKVQIGKKDSEAKMPWVKPSVTEISRFSILSLASVTSVTENSTFRAKSA